MSLCLLVHFNSCMCPHQPHQVNMLCNEKGRETGSHMVA